MFNRFKKVTLTHIKTEYPFLISVLLFSIAAESLIVVRPELKYIVNPASTLLIFAAFAIRFPTSSRKLTEALKDA
jgi:hypothetical protein